ANRSITRQPLPVPRVSARCRKPDRSTRTPVLVAPELRVHVTDRLVTAASGSRGSSRPASRQGGWARATGAAPARAQVRGRGTGPRYGPRYGQRVGQVGPGAGQVQARCRPGAGMARTSIGDLSCAVGAAPRGD